MKFTSLTNDEQAACGFTHRLDFSYRDIPSGIANNTSHVWSTTFLPQLKTSDIMKRVQLHITTPFLITGSTDTDLDIGDENSTNRYISDRDIIGTDDTDVFPGASENYIYTTNYQLYFTLSTPGASSSLSNATAGKLYVLFAIDKAAGQFRQEATPFGTGYA